MAEIWMDGKPLAKLEVIFSDMEGLCFFIRGVTVDGEKIETGIVKGSI